MEKGGVLPPNRVEGAVHEKKIRCFLRLYIFIKFSPPTHVHMHEHTHTHTHTLFQNIFSRPDEDYLSAMGNQFLY